MKLFSEISINQYFVHQNIEYKKIQPIKVSCCKSYNAEQKDNPSNKIFIQPGTVVSEK